MPHVTTVEPADLFFEDFAEGQEFPTVTKGPMLVGHQVRWAGACDNYDSEFHHDEHVAKSQGLPGIILSGPLMAAYLMTEIGRWLGRNARLLSFADRNTGSTMPRDLAHLRGRVKKKYEQDGQGVLEIECWIENQRGEITTPARAAAVVARRNR